MGVLKQKKGDSSVGTAISVVISVVLGGLILSAIIYLIDHNVSPNMAKTFEEQQINVSRTVSAEDAFAAGDINKDGVINASDYEYLKAFLEGSSGYTCDSKVADIDGDGNITNSDLGILKNRLETSGVLTYQLGDINKDGQVDEGDITYMERYLAGWSGYNSSENGDINGDGSVNITDLNLLKCLVS